MHLSLICVLRFSRFPFYLQRHLYYWQSLTWAIIYFSIVFVARVGNKTGMQNDREQMSNSFCFILHSNGYFAIPSLFVHYRMENSMETLFSVIVMEIHTCMSWALLFPILNTCIYMSPTVSFILANSPDQIVYAVHMTHPLEKGDINFHERWNVI